MLARRERGVVAVARRGVAQLVDENHATTTTTTTTTSHEVTAATSDATKLVTASGAHGAIDGKRNDKQSM